VKRSVTTNKCEKASAFYSNLDCKKFDLNDFQYGSLCKEMNTESLENIAQDLALAQSSGKLCLSSGELKISC